MQKLKYNIRKWVIKQGLIPPRNLKEAQNIFKFEARIKPSPNTINLGTHIKKVL